MYIPNSKWTWAFFGTAFIQAGVVLAFEAFVFASFQKDLSAIPAQYNANEDVKKIPTAVRTFLALYIFGFVYDLILVYDALRMKNTIQVIGLVIMNAGLLIYGAIQLDTVQDAVNQLTHSYDPGLWPMLRPYMIAIPCILGVTTIVMAFIAYKLYHEFAWTIYKHISADVRMKRRYLNYQIYIALLKFDFFFFLGFTIQFVVIVRGRSDAEFGLTIAAIPVTIFILFMAAFFTRREILVGMIGVIVLFFAGLAYFIFKLNRIYQTGFSQAYQPARKELTTFAVLTILLIVITIIYACICCAAFKQGLKPIISKSASTDVEKPNISHSNSSRYSDAAHGHAQPYGYAQDVEMTDSYGKGGRVAPTRMEID